MSVPSTQIIAVWVKEALTLDKWVPLGEISGHVLRNKWGRGESEISDLLEDKLKFIAEHLRDDLSECYMDGRVQEFEIDNEDPPYVRRTSARHLDLLQKLRRIDPYIFEEVCARILSALGARSFSTQKTNDGGVDFVATELKIVPSILPMPRSCHGIVVGQAKRFKEGAAISETRLREFVGAALLERYSLGTRSSLGPLTPALFAFWTTSDLDRNARIFARSMGLWYMDGVTLSAYAEELGLRAYVMDLPDHVPSSPTNRPILTQEPAG